MQEQIYLTKYFLPAILSCSMAMMLREGSIGLPAAYERRLERDGFVVDIIDSHAPAEGSGPKRSVFKNEGILNPNMPTTAWGAFYDPQRYVSAEPISASAPKDPENFNYYFITGTDAAVAFRRKS